MFVYRRLRFGSTSFAGHLQREEKKICSVGLEVV